MEEALFALFHFSSEDDIARSPDRQNLTRNVSRDY